MINSHALNRARRGALAGGKLCPFKSRPRRRRACQQTFFVAEDDFGIGADINNKRHFIVQMRGFGKHDTSRIRTHMACDAGQQIDERTRRNR